MLTVWRKLHVETDTMVRPTFVQNTYMMNWSTPRTGPTPTQVLFDVDVSVGGSFQSDDDQFRNGYVELQNPAGVTFLVAHVLQYESFDPLDTVWINLPDCGNGLSGLACLGGVTTGSGIISVCTTRRTRGAAPILVTWPAVSNLYTSLESFPPPNIMTL